MEDIIEFLNQKYGKEAPLMVHQGSVEEYLGMMIDYSQSENVSFTMHEFIDGVLAEAPDSLMKGTSTTSAALHLFHVNSDATSLSTTGAVLYHHLVAKLLYLAKQTPPSCHFFPHYPCSITT